MALQEKQIGQSNPGVTTTVSLYSPPANTTAIIKTIFVCNSTANIAKFRIFVDDDGSTATAATALFYDATVNPYTTVEIDTYIAMNNQLGDLRVRTDTASALTFTAFGAEEA